MNPKKLTDFGVIRRYCATLRRNGDNPTRLMDRLCCELERRGLVGAMLYYLPVYLHWHEQGHSSEATAALVAVELELTEARLTRRMTCTSAPNAGSDSHCTSVRGAPGPSRPHRCDFCATPKNSAHVVSVESWPAPCEPFAGRHIDALPLNAATER